MLKKYIKVYIWFFSFILLYLPYRAMNYFAILKIFGNNPHTFNANDVTIATSILVALLSVLFFVLSYIKEFGLKTKKEIIIFSISLLVLIISTYCLREFFILGNMWDNLDVI
ncbi:MAG: hypothetical protein PHG08_06185 [Bacilli bacterium]|jgi:predicted secreted protein|nr:hypothetical protein [Bacilli bacterium]HHU24514.1 hypothetical protein [Acholeplasmataceae bacterium]